MARIRIATFNVENLYSRIAYADNMAPGENHVGLYRFDDPEELRLARRIAEAVASDDKRQLTALALNETRADVVCLQEVDNANALRVFYERYLKPQIDTAAAVEKRSLRTSLRAQGRGPTGEEIGAIDRHNYFDWRQVVEGNDGRGIDVGVMSKYPIRVTSHANRTFAELGVWSAELESYREYIGGKERSLAKSDKLFRRDCLEVDVELGQKSVTIFVCHLKSMSQDRAKTRVMRHAESLAIRTLIERRFGPGASEAPWLVCGDFNDYVEIDGAPETDQDGNLVPHGLTPLLDPGFSVNLVARRPADDRWTTYYAPGDLYTQIDFILASPGLARANPNAVPEIIRGGQPYRAKRYEGPRYPRIGWDRPKASDHSPIVVELEI
ncbi:MAG: endonuclease/exonuclease/phosphatase family protein [Hyphomicrobiaceae bacterium]